MPGHAGAEGNEKADLHISGAARMSEGVCEGGDISLAALRAVRARKANDMWRDEIKRRNKGRGVSRCSGGGLETLTSRGPGQHSEGSGISFLSASKWTCDACPLLKGEMEVGGVGHLLVVWDSKTDKGELLQGV